MRIYLGAQYKWKLRMQEYAKELEAAGHECTSQWLLEDYSPDMLMAKEKGDWGEIAAQDLEDIADAELMVLFTVPEDVPTVRGGRHVEAGYALGVNKDLVVVGPRENIFYHLSTVKQFDTWEDFKTWLQQQ